jgi:hypothetical protein
MKHDALKQRHRALRDGYPPNLNLRVHRALSWLKRADMADDDDVRSATGYLGGAYGSIWLHEAGHALALKTMGGTDIKINVPREGCWLCAETVSKPIEGGFRPLQTQIISAAGLFAANLAGEWVVQHPAWQGSALAQGALGTALYSNVAHVYAYYTRRVGVDDYRGNDIDAYEAAGGNPHIMSATLLAYTAWTLHRMQKKEIPFFFIRTYAKPPQRRSNALPYDLYCLRHFA